VRQKRAPIICVPCPSNDDLQKVPSSYNQKRRKKNGAQIRSVWEMIYVLDPSAPSELRPNLPKAHPVKPSCPLTGNTLLSSTPPNVRAPIPTHTTTASGGEPGAVRGQLNIWGTAFNDLIDMLYGASDNRTTSSEEFSKAGS
jgi:hypothetical protein